MSEKSNPNVEVRGDYGLESLGENPYFIAKNANFDSRAHKTTTYIVVFMMLIIFVGMFVTKKVDRSSGDAKAFSTPGLARDSSGINPKLLTERDFVNIIRPKESKPSYLGKIRVVSLRGISEMPIGSEMRARLESGATDGIVKARLTRSLVVDGEPILPENTILFGKGKSGDERLFVEFTKVIFPSGDSYSIRAQAFDVSDKIQGLKGAIVGRRTKKMAGALTFGFLGGMAGGLQNTSGSYFIDKKPSTRDAALAGASKAALDQSQVFIEEMKNSPNIIEVKVGSEIVVITDEPKTKEAHGQE